MSPVEISAGPQISLFEKREELRRVLASKYFVSSPKKTRFLEFISDQTFLGNGDKLNEYLIGVEVYDRGVDFDPQRDPIVRVQAHEIRKSLNKYYADEGLNGTLRISIPTGHYVPVFTRNSSSGEVPEGPISHAAVLNGISPRPASAATAVLGVVTFLLALLLVYFIMKDYKAAVDTRAGKLPEELTWFWQPFLPPAEPPLITIPNHPLLRLAHDGDSPQTFKTGHEIPKTTVPEFRDTIHFHELKRFVFVPSLTDFTSVGETLGLVNLCNMFSSVGQRCEVQQSRLTNLDQIKNNNSILLGGNQAWSGRVFLDKEGFHFQSSVIYNPNPQHGERAVYRPEFDPVTNELTRDYALVLMLPNETGEKRVLLIYGIYTQGSQAAIEYLTNRERMSELRTALLKASPDQKTIPPYFQLLLSTSVENAVPGNASLVALRILGVSTKPK